MKRAKKWVAGMLFSCFVLCCLPLSALALSNDIHNTVMAGGNAHSLAVKADGSVWAWGLNEIGQLGLGNGISGKERATRIEDLKSIVEVSAGYTYSVALNTKGEVYTWGQFEGQPVLWKPVLVEGLTNIVSISAGQKRLLALDKKGQVYEYAYGAAPYRISIPSTVIQVAAGGDFYLALDTNGAVYAWGANAKGQLGNGNTTVSAQPQRIKALSNVVDIAAGHSHALALDGGGAIWTWGSNAYGELGIPNEKGTLTQPIKMESELRFQNIEAGFHSSLAITTKNEVYAWGYGEYGQNGDGSVKNHERPTLLSGNYSGKQIACGLYHNLLLSTGNNLYTWGRNRNGQLGNGETENALAPLMVVQGLADTERYNLMTTGASSWATEELNALYARDLVPMYAWRDFTNSITRAEFAAILVDTYEAVRKTSVEVKEPVLFTDTRNTTFELQIAKAVTLGICNGKSDILFDPDGLLTRQEAAKMICIFSTIARNTQGSFTGKDVSQFKDAYQIAAWAVPYVSHASQNDIMSGSTDKNFHPIQNLSKQEGMLLVARLAKQHSW